MYDILQTVTALAPAPTGAAALTTLFTIFTLKGAFIGKVFPTSIFLPGYVLATGASWFEAGVIVVVVSIGYVLGQVLIYGGSRRYGPTFVARLPYATVDADSPKLARLDEWFGRYGGVSIVATNFVPWIRGLVAIPAGVSAYPSPRFALHTGTSTLLYHGLYVALALAGLDAIS